MTQIKRLAAASIVVLTGTAMAQSSVGISGVLDEFVAVHHTGGKNNYRVDSNGMLGSRVVFRGSEDLGGGLRANFFLEHGFNPDSGAQTDPTRYFNRQSWVGFSSSQWGDFRVGRLTSPQFFMLGLFDAFQGATMGSSLSNLSAYPVRFDNAFGYITPPTLGPFRVQVTAALNEAATGRKMEAGIVGLEYRRGPLSLGANYANGQNAATLVVTRAAFAGGNYDFGKGKVFVGYFQTRIDNGSLDRMTLGISAQYNVTPALTLVAGYARANDRTPTNADAWHASTGFFYEMSKRTMLYSNVSKMWNNRGAKFSLNGATALGFVPKPGDDVAGAQLGIRHLF